MANDEADRVKTPIGEMWVDNGVLWHRIDVAEVTLEAVDGVKDAIVKVTGGTPMPSIVDMQAVAYADAATREAFAFGDDGGLELATALIVFNTGSTAMAHLFENRTDPGRPVRMFVDPDEAERWARSFIE